MVFNKTPIHFIQALKIFDMSLLKTINKIVHIRPTVHIYKSKIDRKNGEQRGILLSDERSFYYLIAHTA